jgi:hypothetical protein
MLKKSEKFNFCLKYKKSFHNKGLIKSHGKVITNQRSGGKSQTEALLTMDMSINVQTKKFLNEGKTSLDVKNHTLVVENAFNHASLGKNIP